MSTAAAGTARADCRDCRPGADGKLPPIGDTADVEKATFTNTIGSPEPAAIWTDPSFDPVQRACYYARVIEIPTPRSSAYDAYRVGMDAPPEVPRKTQERAYTSPIGYTPNRICRKSLRGSERLLRPRVQPIPCRCDSLHKQRFAGSTLDAEKASFTNSMV